MIWQLERTRPEKIGLPAAKAKKFLQMVQHDKTEMHGVMAMKDGKVFLESWWAPFGREFPHSCHSMGKSYTCTAIGLACTEGLLSMDDRIADLFADEIKQWNIRQTPQFERLLVRHVVTMTNGMEHMSELTDDWIRLYLENPVVFEPGTRFLYNTAGSCLLAVLVKKVTGKDVFAYLSEKLFPYIGIDPASMVWLKFHDGNIAEPGCFSLTENNLRLGMLYACGGKIGDKQLIDPQWIRDALHVHIATDAMPGGDDSHCGYGYQLWRCNYPGAWRFDGGQGQYCIILPERGILVAINEGGIEPYGPAKTLEMVYRYLLDEIEDAPVPEDDAAWNDLVTYAGSRSVVWDEPNRFLPAQDHFSGTYRVLEGTATPWIGVSPGGFNFFESFYDASKKKEMTDFTLAVTPETVTLTVDSYADFIARFDGGITVHETDSVLPGLRRTYSTAAFTDEDTLLIRIHWISGWFVTEMNFHREKDGTYRVSASKNILNEQRPWFTEYSTAVRTK